MNSTQNWLPNRLSLAVITALVAGSAVPVMAQSEDEDKVIEEVVATGTRLKGTAAAVMQERQNQAFVADIMGAEQISRTGDGDAASALRRVTGLTLVDGKFIYVRGLGERYSSTQLNGMMVPSPDPTRSVVPLDLFPSDIIESLNVQKSFSPNMPAHFGGGNVNIRTKSIPSDFIFKVSGSLGWNTNNSDDGYFYEGGDDDWSGRDDGTRALPQLFVEAFRDYQSAGIEGSSRNRLTLEDRQALLGSMNWDIGPDTKSVDPNMSLGATLGNDFELEQGVLGFLAAVSYSNEWLVANESNGTNLGTTGCSEAGEKCFAQFYEGVSTEQNVRWSGMFNIGYEYNNNHKIELTNIILHDMSDELRNRLFTDVNETETGKTELRRVDLQYEERRMTTSQIKGTHNFPELNFAYLDWYAGTSRASRDAPGALDVIFQQNFVDGVFESEQLQDVSATNLTREYQTLSDEADTWGWNFGYPLRTGKWDIELKAGGDFFEKARTAENIKIGVPHRAIADDATFGSRIDEIFSPENLNSADFYNSSTGAGIFDDGTTDGDKYAAGSMLDAYYLMADVFYDNKWRFSGGVRFEDFRQLSIPFQAHTGLFDVNSEEIAALSFQEDDVFPSLAMTYIMDDEMQFRLNVSQTAIRPDMRDISTSFFVDPLTEFLVRGSPTLQSAKLDNIDLRWEWYMADGNNLSVALFYKDMENPIEMVELASVGGAAPSLLTANAQEGELKGVEVEFLHDLGFMGDWGNAFFMTGNLTFSDSSVNLGIADDGVDSLFEQQLKDALDATTVSNIVTNNERRLVGHSEWVANMQFGWDSDNGEHSASLVYNVFGPRIIVPGTRGNADAEEESFHSLDLVYTYYPTFETTFKIKLQNLLGEDKEITQEGLFLWKKEVGTSISASFSWEF
ncbi:TonB-dependent receptor domain-containing protein [Bowmanella dokdonensis]|uniref:TonB-dependent receptor n=1 Tax=Bowmanella dokdonensis TaxID=751969 RepID=A0A939DPA9_9ALTE|nr:TonB-dependent receptor [Bowmanella dokdonensis]MBN7826280.1 TonB-dependent receptor [Bowmanella dokdonensis]